MFSGYTPAIFVFGRIVRNAAVHTRNLYAHITPHRVYRLPAAAQTMALLLPAADTKGCCLGKDETRQSFRIGRIAEHGQQGTRPVLLHLHGHAESIQCPLLQQAIHHVTENLRIQVVKIRLQDRDGLFRDIATGFRLTDRHSCHIGMSSNITGSRAISHSLDFHLRKR